jgi:hypothetical protein
MAKMAWGQAALPGPPKIWRFLQGKWQKSLYEFNQLWYNWSLMLHV